MIRSTIRSVGHYLPKRIVPNSEFEKNLDTNDEWIRTRTGISQRHFASNGESTSDMAVRAAREAVEAADMDPKDIDLIVVATSTPDLTFPSTATKVQAELGILNGFAFDMQAVCAGFVYALANANALLTTGQARRALVIGAETFSHILDMEDRSTCILFGDGAGALLLEASEQTGSNQDPGILASEIRSDGRYRDLLYVDGGVSTTQTSGFIRMNGREIFRHAVEKLVESSEVVLQKAGLATEDADLMVPHQANLRIIYATAKRLGFPKEKIVTTVDQHGNTSAASIPLALSCAHLSGQLQKGQLVVTNAIGGGLTWGSIVMRW